MRLKFHWKKYFYNTATVSNPPIEDVFTDLDIVETFSFDDAIMLVEINSTISDPRRSFVDFASYIQKVQVENGLLFKVDKYPLYNEHGISIGVMGVRYATGDRQ